MNEDQEQPGLFAVEIPPAVEMPPAVEPEPDPYEGMSAGRKLTARRLAMLKKGIHPITGLPLHAEAAPVDDRKADGRRCGDCIFRRLRTGENGSWAKCFLNPTTRQPRERLTGPAPDVAAWMPGCTAHERIAA